VGKTCGIRLDCTASRSLLLKSMPMIKCRVGKGAGHNAGAYEDSSWRRAHESRPTRTS
jgi:hypothetical protein